MISPYGRKAQIYLVCCLLMVVVLVHSTACADNSYRGFASLESVDFRLLGAYTDAEMDNPFPAFGPKYKEIVFLVTVSVAHAGLYRVALRYDYAWKEEKGSTPLHMVEKYLPVGQQVLEVRFAAHELKGSYGFWSPSAVGGVADVQLSYLVPRQKLLDDIAKKTGTDNDIAQRFLQDESNENSAVPVNKFIEKRLFSFDK